MTAVAIVSLLLTVLALGLLLLLGRRRFGVGRKPGGEVLALFDVVGAQDAADVGVVFGVAVGFA